MYVEVLWRNIKPAHLHDFSKFPRTLVHPWLNYDFKSVMHFDLDAFGVDEKPTLQINVRRSFDFEFTF